MPAFRRVRPRRSWPIRFLKDLGRLARFAWEYLRGVWVFEGGHPRVTVFGSARFGPGHPYFEVGKETGRCLARAGFVAMTGGGPGIMEAVSQGAREAGGRAFGCNIQLPREQSPNSHLDRFVTFRYFFVRKIMLVRDSAGALILPGGLGTLDELTEVATLRATGKLEGFPLVLVGKDYWRGFLDWARGTLVREGAVSSSELDGWLVTDSPEEAVRWLQEHLLPRSRVPL